jgi:hypothetical protein
MMKGYNVRTVTDTTTDHCWEIVVLISICDVISDVEPLADNVLKQVANVGFFCVICQTTHASGPFHRLVRRSAALP